MSASLTTSPIMMTSAAAAPAAAASSAETPAGSEFQPVLAALSQAAADGDAATAASPAATLPAASALPEAGNTLPVDGESLPPELLGLQLEMLPVASGDQAAAPPLPDTATALPPTVVGLPVSPLAEEAVSESLSDRDSDEPVDEQAVDLTALTGDGQLPLPADPADTAATVPPPVSAPITVTSAPASTFAPAPAVGGDVKRMLPESANRKMAATGAADGSATLEGTATADDAPAARPATAADGTRAFDLAALTGADDGAAVESAASAGNNAVGAAPARAESPLRAYQSAAPAAAQVDVPVGRQGWNEAVLEKVMWFSSQQIGSAEIHLNPAELGPLSVRISTHQDQASVYFTSHHASVRDAVDQALPRLREMFDSQGIQLLDAGVGEQRHARQQTNGQGEGGAGGLAGENGDEGADGAGVELGSRAIALGSQRLLDAYA